MSSYWLFSHINWSSVKGPTQVYTLYKKLFPNIRQERHIGSYTPKTEDHIAQAQSAIFTSLSRIKYDFSIVALNSLHQNGLITLDVFLRVRQFFMGTNSRRMSYAISPTDLSKTLKHDTYALIKDSSDLMNITFEALNHIQYNLSQGSESILLWTSKSFGKKGIPRDEPIISRYIGQELQKLFYNKKLICFNEVEVKPKSINSKGNKPDILIAALDKSSGDKISLNIEVKGQYHPEVKQAMKTQLRERYVKQSGSHCGLYIVAYFPIEDWDVNEKDPRMAQAKKNFRSLSEAKDEMDTQANFLSKDKYDIHSFVLDLKMH